MMELLWFVVGVPAKMIDITIGMSLGNVSSWIMALGKNTVLLNVGGYVLQLSQHPKEHLYLEEMSLQKLRVSSYWIKDVDKRKAQSTTWRYF